MTKDTYKAGDGDHWVSYEHPNGAWSELGPMNGADALVTLDTLHSLEIHSARITRWQTVPLDAAIDHD